MKKKLKPEDIKIVATQLAALYLLACIRDIWCSYARKYKPHPCSSNGAKLGNVLAGTHQDSRLLRVMEEVEPIKIRLERAMTIAA